MSGGNGYRQRTNVPANFVRTAADAHADAIAAGALCHRCALYGCGRGPVPGDIVPNADLIVIGEAPGKHEVEDRRVFCGASGIELSQSLIVGGLSRNRATVTNAIACQPPEALADYLERLEREHRKACAAAAAAGQEPPTAKLSPVDACAPRLEREIAIANARTILAVGGEALRQCARHARVPFGKHKTSSDAVFVATISKQHGSPIRLPDGRILMSSLHPAFAMRNNRQYTQIVRDNIARAARIVTRGHAIDWNPPQGEYFAVWPEDVDVRIARIAKFVDLYVANATRARLVCDVETDSIGPTADVRCIGLGMRIDGTWHTISIPRLWRSGRSFWPSVEYRAVVDGHIRRALDACHLVFHNGLFDTRVLLRLGLMTRRSALWTDTMLLHRNTDANDLPHDLGFVVRQYTEAPLWKSDPDHKADENTEKDSDLHLYNLRDVYGTAAIVELLEERVVNCGNVEAFRLDSALAPIARDMGSLGVWIDEHVRGELSTAFNTITRDLVKKLRRIVGDETFNPRSSAQLAAYIFGERGYVPTLTPDGYTWEDENDAVSTSIPAIMALADRGVAPEDEAFIEALIEYKSCEKLRASNTDGLRVVYDWEDKAAKLDATWLDTYPVDFSSPGTPAASVDFDGIQILPPRPALSWMPLSWKIHVVPGGRWVCQPTVQNWTARGWVVNGKPTNMRRMIVAPPGHVLVGADYEQIELRIYGVVADDQHVLRAFHETMHIPGSCKACNGTGVHNDPHCLNAATIMAERESDIMKLYGEFMVKHFHGTKEEKSEMKYVRTIAKRVCYLKNYGGEDDKLFSAMAAERDKATGKRVFPHLKAARVAEWEERWERRHPETKHWHRRVHAFLRQNDYVTTGKRKRYFRGGANKRNAPPNHEIQGRAGDIKNEAILRIHEAIPFGKWSRYTGLCMDIHDYLAVFVPESRADEACAILNKCMYTEMTCNNGKKMPIFAEAKASRNLADNA